jgi:hypothetical protein
VLKAADFGIEKTLVKDLGTGLATAVVARPSG